MDCVVQNKNFHLAMILEYLVILVLKFIPKNSSTQVNSNLTSTAITTYSYVGSNMVNQTFYVAIHLQEDLTQFLNQYRISKMAVHHTQKQLHANTFYLHSYTQTHTHNCFSCFCSDWYFIIVLYMYMQVLRTQITAQSYKLNSS